MILVWFMFCVDCLDLYQIGFTYSISYMLDGIHFFSIRSNVLHYAS